MTSPYESPTHCEEAKPLSVDSVLFFLFVVMCASGFATAAAAIPIAMWGFNQATHMMHFSGLGLGLLSLVPLLVFCSRDL